MDKKIIDLTFPIHEGMTTFPVHWHPFVEISILGRHGLENRETLKDCHWHATPALFHDAPRHFIPTGQTIDKVPPTSLIGPAVLVDFSDRKKREYCVADFEAQLKNKTFERLVMRFDWSEKWGTNEYYSDHPYITAKRPPPGWSKKV